MSKVQPIEDELAAPMPQLTPRSQIHLKKGPPAYLPRISKATADAMLSARDPRSVIVLYFLYTYTATWQGTNRPYATTTYCAKKLGMSKSRVRQAKRQLIEIGLVQDYAARSENGHISKWYIHLKYIRSGDHPCEIQQRGTAHLVETQTPDASTAVREDSSSAYNKNAQNPQPPLQGEKGEVFLSKEELKRSLLRCLHQDPNRTLNAREEQLLNKLTLTVTSKQIAMLRSFLSTTEDPTCCGPDELRVLKLRKRKFTTLIANLPEQLELARHWPTLM